MRYSSIGKSKKPVALFILLILFTCFTMAVGYGAEPALIEGASAEEPAISETAKKYLDAEVKRDLEAVYGYLAPSSIYYATHDYAAYLAEAEASPVRILEYKILRIAHIRDNDDKQNFPGVEKFARVEVDMKVFYTDTGQTAEVNFDFTFIKEGGRWYKG
ncbi:MAG: hypothetical protein NTX62_04150 [Deltaproteobacteria bacterium]|nr:hypothetical protein [Deltaproteobacteria bacterium]